MSGIKLASGFDLSSPVPLDSRQSVSDLAARDAIPAGVRYEGMTVYVKSEKKQYWLKGGVDNSDFVEVGDNEAIQDLTQKLEETNSEVSTVKTLKADKSEVNTLADKKADVSYVNQQVQASNLQWKMSFATLQELETVFPNGDGNNHAVLSDGYIYTWYNNLWTNTLITANAQNVADGTITPQKTTFLNIDNRNMFNPSATIDGYRLGPSGELLLDAMWSTSDYTPVTKGKTYRIITGTNSSNVTGRVCGYNSSKTFEKVISTGITTRGTFTVDFDGFVRIPVKTVDKELTQLVDDAVYDGNFIPYGYFLESKVKAQVLDIGVVESSNLKDNFRYRGNIINPDLNALLKDGTYLISSGAINRPTEVTDSNAYLVVTNINNTIIQDYTEYTALKQRKVFRRYIRINVNEFGQWFLMNRDEEQGANYLENKTIVLMGDSITGSSGYRGQLAKRLRANVINCGFGGTRMTYHSDPNFDKFSFTKLVDAKIANDFTDQDEAASILQVTNMPQNLANLKGVDFSTVNYLTIWFGTNDFSGDIYIGENGSEDITTVKGALQYGIRRLLEAYPQLKIIVITPMFRTVGSGNSDDTVNSYRLLNLNDYVKAIEEVANINHIPCLNMYKESGINKFNHTHYLSDGLHPYLEKGYTHVGNKIASFISSNF